MGSENSLFYEGLVDYLTKDNRSSNNQQLLHENRELRIALDNLHNEYLNLKAQQENSKKIIDQLIGGNHPRVSHPNGLMTRCWRIIKFKDVLLSQNGINSNDQKAIDALPLNTKRLININLLAFGELLSLNEIVLNYVSKNMEESFRNMKSEANILAEAITKNNGLEVHAIQAWGYLQMSMSMVFYNSDFIKHALDVINNEDKANEWLKNRINQLVNNLRFYTDSPIPIEDTIPNPMELWEIQHINKFFELKSISSSLSGNRPSYVFDIKNTDGYPKAPKGEELIHGPINFVFDKALLWGVKLINSNSKLPEENLVEQTLRGERIPTLLNRNDPTRLDTLQSQESVQISLLNNYGIKS